VRVLARNGKDGSEHVLEDRLYATNLVRGRLKPEHILDLVRAHWRIENNCFGRLDIEWKEDHGYWGPSSQRAACGQPPAAHRVQPAPDSACRSPAVAGSTPGRVAATT